MRLSIGPPQQLGGPLIEVVVERIPPRDGVLPRLAGSAEVSGSDERRRVMTMTNYDKLAQWADSDAPSVRPTLWCTEQPPRATPRHAPCARTPSSSRRGRCRPDRAGKWGRAPVAGRGWAGRQITALGRSARPKTSTLHFGPMLRQRAARSPRPCAARPLSILRRVSTGMPARDRGPGAV